MDAQGPASHLSPTELVPGHWDRCYCYCRKNQQLPQTGSGSCTSIASASLSPSICCPRASEWPDLSYTLYLAARESQSLLAFQALQFRKALEKVMKWMFTAPPQTIKG